MFAWSPGWGQQRPVGLPGSGMDMVGLNLDGRSLRGCPDMAEDCGQRLKWAEGQRQRGRRHTVHPPGAEIGCIVCRPLFGNGPDTVQPSGSVRDGKRAAHTRAHACYVSTRSNLRVAIHRHTCPQVELSQPMAVPSVPRHRAGLCEVGAGRSARSGAAGRQLKLTREESPARQAARRAEGCAISRLKTGENPQRGTHRTPVGTHGPVRRRPGVRGQAPGRRWVLRPHLDVPVCGLLTLNTSGFPLNVNE